MEESQPLRRSTRNSVVLKNEELTPRKRKVSTPVKAEPSTPSRRTRASSATPKKNLIEVMNTPKKALPVLSEEENVTKITRTPVKNIKETSPKTPRRRSARESVSVPTKAPVDKSTKKSADASEEINVTASRPLTRAKRKTMGEIQASEVTKSLPESEKGVQNKKDKPESSKVVQNKKDKPISDKSVQNIKDEPELDKAVQNIKDEPESDKDIQNEKDIPTTPDSDGITSNSPDKKQVESIFALVPKVVITDIKEHLKEGKNVENVVEENNCGMFTSKSPVRAEDVAINSPRKVPENCKSISESSLKSDSDYINSRSQKITVDPASPISSVGITDIGSVENNDISSVKNTDISSVEQVSSNTSDNTNIVLDTGVTSPEKVTDSKDICASNIINSSPKPVIDSKDNSIPNIVITSPQKVTVPEGDIPNTVISSPQKVTDSKGDVPSIVITSPSPQKITDSKVDTPNIVITSPSPQKATNSKDDIPNIVITSPSPKKVSDSEDNNKNSPLTSGQSTSPTKNEADTSIVLTDIKEEGIHEPSEPETLSSSINVDSTECKVSEDVCVKKSSESDSPVATDRDNVVEIVPNVNEVITIDDETAVENENIEDMNESKLNKTADQAINLDASLCLNESRVGNNPEEVTPSIPVVKESVTEVAISQVENEKSEKDDKLITDATSPSSANNASCSPDKVLSSEARSTEASGEDNNPNGILPSTSRIPTEVDMVQNNSEKVNESLEKNNVSSPVKPDNSSSSNQPESAENEMDAAEKKDDEGAAGPKGDVESSPESPVFYIRCECETSEESGDSGIHNDDNVIIFQMSTQFKKHIKEEARKPVNRPGSRPSTGEGSRPPLDEGNVIDVLKSEGPVTLEDGENKSTAVESGTSDVKLSPGKSDEISVVYVENDHSDVNKIETVAENSSKISESNEDCADKSNGLDEILMSPNEFLNSDEESNMDSEQSEDSQSKNGSESCGENQSSEEPTIANVDHSKPPVSETQDSLNVTLSNDSSEDSSSKVDKKKDHFDDTTVESATNEVESNVSTAILCDSKSESIPTDEVNDTCLDKEKEEVSSQKYSEEKNYESKNSSNSASEDNQISENKSESLSMNDILEKTKSSKPGNSIKENESEVSKTETNLPDDVNISQTVSSPEIDVVNSVKDSDSDEEDGLDMKKNQESNKKNTKYIKNRRKNFEMFESETDASQSDADSELSNSPPSNAATEGSSDRPLSGKDFIDFEAEEGEETSDDDSFIVSSQDSTASSSSDKPRFNMKLRKRKRNLDAESSDSCDYIDSVQRLFDSTMDTSKDDSQKDSPIKNKKPKLEKVSTVNKKKQKPKSILKNKHAVFESAEIRNRNKIKTENKVIKELSKTGVFIVSSISQPLEGPKLSRNISKRSSKLQQKRSEISDYDNVPKGFSVDDASDNVTDDAALRGFVVSYDESYLIRKKPRKAVTGSSELISKKKKIKEGKNIKKAVKKSFNSEPIGNNENKTVSSFIVTLILPFPMTFKSVSNVLTDLGLRDISSISFPRPKVAVVEFSNKEPYKQILKLYGELKIKDKPIYILEGCSLV